MFLCITSETTHDGQTVFWRDDGVSFEPTTQHLYAYPDIKKTQWHRGFPRLDVAHIKFLREGTNFSRPGGERNEYVQYRADHCFRMVHSVRWFQRRHLHEFWQFG